MKYINTLTLEVFESEEDLRQINIMPLRNYLELVHFKPVEDELEFLKGGQA
ncbi:hypothetical protein [Alkaliphilus sp. B6464]|uniref:hypothetical protein n=1 Tax=Alkaliphilus sp. B6464 TaxID=2731219 RepID=UPI001BA6DF13|nr:hypothetical protein [Alkaliphilus sp. B6464]QUH21454.1 hypothetical protein HYG84_17230 [Alkaliphilus sp. B6464]